MFTCCAFEPQSGAGGRGGVRRVKTRGLKKSTVPRYQVIMDCETLLAPSPVSASIGSSNLGQKWKLENGYICSRLSGMVLDVRNGEEGRKDVIVWSKKPFSNESQQWSLLTEGFIQHIATGLFLEVNQDDLQTLQLCEKETTSTTTSPSSQPPSSSSSPSLSSAIVRLSLLPKSFSSLPASSSPLVPSLVPSSANAYSSEDIPMSDDLLSVDTDGDHSSFDDDSSSPSPRTISRQRWRLTSQGYILNLSTRKVLCPSENKVGSKIILKPKARERSLARTRSYSFDDSLSVTQLIRNSA